MPSGHFSESTGESMAGNTRKLLRTSEPSTQRSRSYCPFTEPTLQDAFFEAHRNRLSQGSHLHLQRYTSRPPTATDHSGPLWHRRPRFRVAAKVEIHPLDSRSQ